MLLRKLYTNQYIQLYLFGIATICFILAGIETEIPIFLLVPFFALAAILLIFNPSVVVFLFIGSFYVGNPLVYKLMFLVDVADITLVLLAIALFSVLLTASKPTISIGATDKKIVAVLLLFILISSLSILLNVSSKKLFDIATSIWYTLNFIQLVAGYLIFSRSFFLDRRETYINVVLVFSGIEILLATGQFMGSGSSDVEMLREIRGTFVNHHGMLGNMMVIAMAFCLYRLTTATVRFRQIAYFFGAVASLFAITISGSRSTLLGIFAAGLIWLLATFKLSRKYFLTLCIILAVLAGIVLFTPLRPLLMNTFKNSQTSTLDMSSYERILIWRGALVNFAEMPLPQKIFGIGIGNYYTMIFKERLIEGTKNALGAHNNPLNVLIETGIAGLLVFGILFTIILANLHRRSKSDRLCFFYFYATIALLFSGITQETFWFQPAFSRFWLFYMVFLACCLGGGRECSRIVSSE